MGQVFDCINVLGLQKDFFKMLKLRVMVFITQHGIPIIQAKMDLSHKACITHVFEKVIKNKLSHKILKKNVFYRNPSRMVPLIISFR